MEVVQTIDDIEANIRRLERYLNSTDANEREFARSLVRRGLCFVAVEREGGIVFGPSRFVGYRQNSRAAHEANDYKDGRETNPVISRVLRRELVENTTLEEQYRRFCERVGVDYRDLTGMRIRRKYWPQA